MLTGFQVVETVAFDLVIEMRSLNTWLNMGGWFLPTARMYMTELCGKGMGKKGR